MPKSLTARLPEQVAQFLELFVESGDPVKSAVAVGCHPVRAKAFVRETMLHPDAREAFDAIMRTRFAKAAPIAMSYLIEVVQDKAVSPAVRVDAAKDLLNRTGYSAKALAQPAAEKDMREMSRDELLRIVQEGEQELAGRAKLVENVPISGADDTEVIDIES